MSGTPRRPDSDELMRDLVVRVSRLERRRPGFDVRRRPEEFIALFTEITLPVGFVSATATLAFDPASFADRPHFSWSMTGPSAFTVYISDFIGWEIVDDRYIGAYVSVAGTGAGEKIRCAFFGIGRVAGGLA